jgi:hypothetical protein
MRCRDGRLQYPGYLSFIMIAVPMTIILLHAAVGEAIIDAAIPAAYSAVLTLGAFLYSKSLAALLITFCVAFAAFNYWGFVYRPASIAHSRRKDKLRRLQYEGHSTSKVNRLRRSESIRAMKTSTYKSSSKQLPSSYLRRSSNIVRRSVQHGITLMSYRRTRSAKKLAVEKKWCSMNRAALSVSVSPGDVRGSGEAALSSTRRMMSPKSRYRMSPESVTTTVRWFSTVSSIRSVPEDIINMLAAVSSPTHDGNERRRKESVFAASTGSAHSDSILGSNSSEYVVMKASTIGYRKAVTPYLLFTSKEAISHLRSRLSVSCELASSEELDVAESSLTDEFRLMLDTFYPEGVALTPTERAEALDEFNDWKESLKDTFTARVQESAAPAHEVRMIHFSTFEEWFTLNFSSILQHTTRDRLLECSLRSMPNTRKRQTRTEPSLLRPESQNMRSISFMIPRPLVTPPDLGLNATTRHLETPLDIKSELI